VDADAGFVVEFDIRFYSIGRLLSLFVFHIQCPTKNQESRLTEETEEDTFPFTTIVTLTEKGEKVICLKLRNS